MGANQSSRVVCLEKRKQGQWYNINKPQMMTVGREPKRQRGNSPPTKRKKGTFEIDDGWDTDMFDYEIDRMIKLSGYEGNHDPKTEEELVRYFGDVQNSKGFDIENDAPWVEGWMHLVDHLRGPKATIIERCARIFVHHYNVKKKGKKILKFDKVVKATRAIECL
ncbi:unnamed protein product [Dovyalis caffra]|uniref:Uncharacterized protein n=1 Tax=Dovyalis caffra TaxID=77055 RepID=A0AAV1SGV3_9ROSI|nr:unnamed protein product [Dovyalis caffra]